MCALRFGMLGLSFATLSMLSACAGADDHAVPLATRTPEAVTCGSPPPVPEPAFWLAYPMPGAVDVPTSTGQLIGYGFPFFGFGNQAVVLASAGGSVSLSDFVAAPSPLPSPYATPPPQQTGEAYYGLTLPALSAQTTYSASFTYTDWADNPPSCRTQITRPLGSFTTH